MPFPEMKSGSGKVYGFYRLGSYTCMLIRAPESIGPIEYLFMLVVNEAESKSPLLIVTCERNQMQSELLSTVAEQLDAATRKEIETAPRAVLGLFDKDGTHHLLEPVDSGFDENLFRVKALSIAAERLGVSEPPVPISPGHGVTPTARDGFFPVELIIAAAVVLIFIFLFPPVEEHFLSHRGEISGHAGWKVISDIGKNNDNEKTESINIGIWFVEFGVAVAAGWIVSLFIRKK